MKWLEVMILIQQFIILYVKLIFFSITILFLIALNLSDNSNGICAYTNGRNPNLYPGKNLSASRECVIMHGALE